MTTLKGGEAYLFKKHVKCMIMRNMKRNGKKSTPVNTEQLINYFRDCGPWEFIAVNERPLGRSLDAID